MNFEQFRYLKTHALTIGTDGMPQKKYETTEVRNLSPLVLAYIGDAVFDLFVRTRLLDFEQNKVRILHDYDAVIVSATMQSLAFREIEASLTEAEKAIVRRGRNAKSTVPKSATVRDYRYSTGFEALLGTLYLTKNYSRLEQISEQAFVAISRAIAKVAQSAAIEPPTQEKRLPT